MPPPSSSGRAAGRRRASPRSPSAPPVPDQRVVRLAEVGPSASSIGEPHRQSPSTGGSRPAVHGRIGWDRSAAVWVLRQLRGRRRAAGFSCRLRFSRGTAFQLLEAELVVGLSCFSSSVCIWVSWNCSPSTWPVRVRICSSSSGCCTASCAACWLFCATWTRAGATAWRAQQLAASVETGLHGAGAAMAIAEPASAAMLSRFAPAAG